MPNQPNPKPAFLKNYETLTQILSDRNLAALGDAYINFAYSLALSHKKGKPCGKKVKGSALAEALRKADLRKTLPSRKDRHELADAAEALLAYSWLLKLTTLEEDVQTLVQADSLENGLTNLLMEAEEKIRLSGLFPVPC
jgi:hypothetical protein